MYFQKQIIFICMVVTALFTATFALAAQTTQKITVMGVELEATDVGYFVDSNILHSFKPVKPVVFTFARGNTFIANSSVFMHKNGNISMALSDEKQELAWKTADGRLVKLNCSYKSSLQFPRINRAVNFHENQEYKSGCDALELVEFKNGNNSMIVSGALDVTDDFKLQYAQKVASATLQIGDSKISLLPGSEVAIHNNGTPRFFKLSQGETFNISHPTYGPIAFMQRAGGQPVSTFLFEDGMVERGILAQDLIHNELKLLIKKDSGVIFSKEENYLLTDILFSVPVDFETKGYSLLAAKFNWDTKNKFYNITTAKPFVFKMPDTGALLNVAAGSLVGLDYDLNIVGIMVPRDAQEKLDLAPTRF